MNAGYVNVYNIFFTICNSTCFNSKFLTIEKLYIWLPWYVIKSPVNDYKPLFRFNWQYAVVSFYSFRHLRSPQVADRLRLLRQLL